jgi:DNA-binding NarL/FixJ family response regulator
MNTDSAIRVLMVGSNNASMQGISNALSNRVGVEVVGETSGGNEAVSATEELSPDVALVLADSLISEMDGIETTRAILETRPWVRVIVITRSILRYLVPALKAGAAGILSPEDGLDEVLLAIRRVHQWASYSLSAQ